MPLHVVNRVAFRGTPGISEGRLREALADRFGRTPSAGQAAAAALHLQSVLRDRGFVSATVEPHIEIDHEHERSTLVFEIALGIQALIGAIRVTGDSVLPQAKVEDELGLDVGDAYDRTALDEGLARFLRELRQLGYYEADVDLRAEPLSERAVTIVADVRSGPKVTLAFEGDP